MTLLQSPIPWEGANPLRTPRRLRHLLPLSPSAHHGNFNHCEHRGETVAAISMNWTFRIHRGQRLLDRDFQFAMAAPCNGVRSAVCYLLQYFFSLDVSVYSSDTVFSSMHRWTPIMSSDHVIRSLRDRSNRARSRNVLGGVMGLSGGQGWDIMWGTGRGRGAMDARKRS